MTSPSSLDELRQSIYSEYHKADFHVHLRRMHAERHRRITHTSRPIVVTSEVTDDKTQYSLKPVAGSVIMFCGRRGSPFLSTLAKAYATGDRDTLMRLSADVDKEVAKRKVVSVETAVNKLIEAPSLFDLHYGIKTLAANVALVNGLEYGSMLFAWNGGQLKDQEFTLTEYARPFEKSDNDFLLVKCKPALSKIEAEALEAVPEDQLALNIGATALSPGFCLVVVLVFVVATHLAGCNEFQDKLSQVSLPASTVKKLGKLTSAVELLSERRAIFEQYGM